MCPIQSFFSRELCIALVHAILVFVMLNHPERLGSDSLGKKLNSDPGKLFKSDRTIQFSSRKETLFPALVLGKHQYFFSVYELWKKALTKEFCVNQSLDLSDVTTKFKCESVDARNKTSQCRQRRILHIKLLDSYLTWLLVRVVWYGIYRWRWDRARPPGSRRAHRPL